MIKNSQHGSSTSVSSKLTKIVDNLNSYGFKLEGDDETVVDLVKKEKIKLTASIKESYPKIYKLLVKYIKAKLTMCYSMEKLYFNKLDVTSPIKGKTKVISAHVLATHDFGTNNKLLILIPDQGEDNQLGIFSKTTLIYNSLKHGSMITYVEAATINNYSVLLMNPNKLRSNKTNLEIPEYSDHYSHCEYIWNEFIASNTKITQIIIIGNGNASISIIKLMNKFRQDFKNRVRKISLINSNHNIMYEILSTEMKMEFERKCTNYILSSEKEGTLLYSSSESSEGCENRSCGSVREETAHFLILDEISKTF